MTSSALAQHQLAQWLTSVIDPVLLLYSGNCLSNSYTFTDQLAELSWLDAWKDRQVLCLCGMQASGDNAQSIIKNAVNKASMHTMTTNWCAILSCRVDQGKSVTCPALHLWLNSVSMMSCTNGLMMSPWVFLLAQHSLASLLAIMKANC